MKKGFTLVELLAVLAVLGIIAVIVIPQVAETLNNSREVALEKQMHVLETSAEKWGLENLDKLPSIDSNVTVTVDLSTLYHSGQITSYPVINPKTNEELTGCVLITSNHQYKQYEYKYSEDLTKCDICSYVNRYTDVDDDDDIDNDDVNLIFTTVANGSINSTLKMHDVDKNGTVNIIDVQKIFVCINKKD